MENRDNGRQIPDDNEEHRVRKPTKLRTLNGIDDERELTRAPSDAAIDPFQLVEEARHEHRISRVVPGKSLFDVDLCAGPYD
jgi:hypothetical protein